MQRKKFHQYLIDKFDYIDASLDFLRNLIVKHT